MATKNIERIRKMYPEGSRVEVINMADPFNPVPTGTRGTVTYIDDIGNIGVHWDNGQGLALIPGEDDFKKVQEA